MRFLSLVVRQPMARQLKALNGIEKSILGKSFGISIVASRMYHADRILLAKGKTPKSFQNSLDILSESYNEKIEQEVVEKLEAPPNVKDDFFAKYDKLNKNLSGDDVSILNVNQGFDLLFEMVQLLETKEEAELARIIVEMWIRSGRIFTRTKSIPLLDAFIEKNQFDVVFDMLCNQAIYGMKPSAHHIYKVFDHYIRLAINPEMANDEKEAFLEQAYKCFILYLYYDIPPSVHLYSRLIAAGIYSKTAFGLEKSTDALQELKSLGWSLDNEGKFAMIHQALVTDNLVEAASELSSIDIDASPEVKNQATKFQVEILVKSKKLDQAKELLEQLKEDKPIHMIGNQEWKSKSELLKLF